MARTVIKFPEVIHFSTDYTVLISDVNSADHLGADKTLAIMIEAQMRFLSHFGYAKAPLIEGVGYIMADTECVYKAESKYGDELLIDVAACNFANKSFELNYRISNKTKGLVAAYIKAGMVFFDYETGATQPVPEKFKKKFI